MVIAMRMVIALLATLPLFGTAKAHSWYDGECCNETDCRQTTLGEVERRDDGWYVVPTKELIPFNDPKVRHSLDALIHICLMHVVDGKGVSAEKIRCIYVPEPPV